MAEDGRTVLSDSGRFGLHMDDTEPKTFGAEIAKLERGLEFDRRAGQLVRDLGDGQPDENLADRIRQLEAEARPGELPPPLEKALRDHEERQRAEAAREYRALIEKGMEERDRMLAESTEPIPGTDEYGRWRQQVETALAGLEAVEPGAGDSPLAISAKDAIDRDEKAARTWSDWRAHEAAAERAGRHPRFMSGHDRLMKRIEGLGPDCPAVLADVVRESRVLKRSIDRLHAVRGDLRRLVKFNFARRSTPGEKMHAFGDELAERPVDFLFAALMHSSSGILGQSNIPLPPQECHGFEVGGIQLPLKIVIRTKFWKMLAETNSVHELEPRAGKTVSSIS